MASSVFGVVRNKVFSTVFKSPFNNPFGVLPWYQQGWAATAVDGTMVYPTWIVDFEKQRYAKGLFNGTAQEVSFSNVLGNFTRASDATYFDASGTLRTAAVNEPRFTHNPATLQPLGLLVEEAKTNSIRNSKLLGGDLAGNVLPTNVSFGTYTGFTSAGRFAGYGNIAGTTGAKYIDIKLTCASSGAVASMVFDTSQAIPAVQNEIFAAGVYVQLIAGSYTNLTTEINVVSRNAGGGFIANESTTLFTATSAVSRVESVATLTAATTAYASHGLVVRSTGAGDITLRIWLPQQEKVSSITQRLSSPILTDGSAVTRAADIPRTIDMSSFNLNATSLVFETIIGTATVFALDTNDAASATRLHVFATPTGVGMFQQVGGAFRGSYSDGVVRAVGTRVKIGVFFGTVGNRLFVNGSLVASRGDNCAMPTVAGFTLGYRRLGSTNQDWLNQPILFGSVYAAQLTDAEFQRLTAL